MRPLITIGLTSYNAIDTIEDALSSALAQDWLPIEVVAVDDASTDGTLEKLHALAQKHPELRVFSNNINAGVATSRNRILVEARGEFVAFFDDDDVSIPGRVSAQYTRIIEYEREFAMGAPVVCHTARHVIYPHGESRHEPTIGENLSRKAPAGIAVAKRILMGEPLEDGYGACPTCSQMARLSTYMLIGGFDTHLRRNEDTELNIRIAQAGGHFVGISHPYVIQMMTPTSEKSLEEEFRNMRLLIEKHRAFMERFGQYTFCLRWINAKQAWLTNRRGTFVKTLFSLMLKHPFLTVRRLALALPHIGLNRAFSRFHIRRDIASGKHLSDNGADG